MATTTHKIVGKAMWARVFESNRDMVGFEGGAKETDGQYQIGLVLDKTGRLALKASGSALQIKFDDDGNVKPVTFRRDHKHRLYDWAGGAPKVTKADGTTWNQETDGFINNDSEVEVSFTVYTTSKANGTRLESVKVLVAAEREEKEETPKAPSASVMSSTGEEEVPF
jgi:hypothetical protein